MGTFFYVVLAFLVGVLVGWFIWGRLRGELDSLRGDLDRTRSERDRLRADSDRLTGELNACGKTRADLERQLRDAQAARQRRGQGRQSAAGRPGVDAGRGQIRPGPAKPAPQSRRRQSRQRRNPSRPKPRLQPNPRRANPQPPAPQPRARPLRSQQPPRQPHRQPAKPAAAKPDNLRRLIGIGPVNEKLLKGQGVTTFAQIAAWTTADIERIEHALQFGGRVERERWVEQAKLLAAGNETGIRQAISDGGNLQQHLSGLEARITAGGASGAAGLFLPARPP